MTQTGAANSLRARAEPALYTAGLLGPDQRIEWTPLTGGVSSDLWRVTADGTDVAVVKAALERLKVADRWTAPTSRNSVEFDWLSMANRLVPGSAPRVIVHDADAGFFAMEYLDATSHPVWKAELLAGRVDLSGTAQVGRQLGRLHTLTQAPEFAEKFRTDDNFAVLRLDPYFRVTASRNPDVAARLEQLRSQTESIHLAVVHGDLSPKNVLLGPDGPVFLDAECAWYGDPAFDVAFCLTHLILKGIRDPERTETLQTATVTLWNAYQEQFVESERLPDSFDALEGRVASLIPALTLARVDGASPVEYLDEAMRSAVREASHELLHSPEPTVPKTVTRCLKLALER